MERETINVIATAIGSVAGLAAAFVAYRAFQDQKAGKMRTADARLTRHLNDVVEARVTLHNRGGTEAVVDLIKVVRPRGAKVAWHFKPDPIISATSLTDTDLTNVHETRIIAKPGESVGSGMLIKLPRPESEVKEVSFRCRVTASDQWRRYRWISCRAMMTSAPLSHARLMADVEEKGP